MFSSLRQRYLLILGLIVSHLIVGLLFAYFIVSSDAFSYYAALERWSDTDKAQFKQFMNLPYQGFLQPMIHNTHLQQRPHPLNRTVFVITPTYSRHTQKVDLLTLCHTLTLTKANVTWIVVEDSIVHTPLVSNLLLNCPIKSVHLAIRSLQTKRLKWHRRVINRKTHHKGVVQRNLGLKWLRDNYSIDNCKTGVVYFADDDNRYDPHLFYIISHTVKVSVWPVGFAGGLPYEGPVCFNHTIHKWKKWAVSYRPERKFPIDMAGFAVGLCEFINKPLARFSPTWKGGRLESEFLSQFVSSKNELECRGSDKAVYAWHVKTAKPSGIRQLSDELYLLEV